MGLHVEYVFKAGTDLVRSPNGHEMHGLPVNHLMHNGYWFDKLESFFANRDGDSLSV